MPRPAHLGLRHLALNVRRMADMKAFYVGVLGFQVEWEPDSANVYLTSGRDNLALHEADAGPAPHGEVIVAQRCDGKAAFGSNSMQGNREVTGDQLQLMLNASYPSTLLTYKEAGATAEMQGRDQIGGRAMFVLMYTPKAGPASKLFLDAETYLLARTVTKLNVRKRAARSNRRAT